MTWKWFLHYWPFVRGIHQWLVDSLHKGPSISSFVRRHWPSASSSPTVAIHMLISYRNEAWKYSKSPYSKNGWADIGLMYFWLDQCGPDVSLTFWDRSNLLISHSEMRHGNIPSSHVIRMVMLLWGCWHSDWAEVSQMSVQHGSNFFMGPQKWSVGVFKFPYSKNGWADIGLMLVMSARL